MHHDANYYTINLKYGNYENFQHLLRCDLIRFSSFNDIEVSLETESDDGFILPSVTKYLSIITISLAMTATSCSTTDI